MPQTEEESYSLLLAKWAGPPQNLVDTGQWQSWMLNRWLVTSMQIEGIYDTLKDVFWELVTEELKIITTANGSSFQGKQMTSY